MKTKTKKKESIRNIFVKQFGEKLADSLERAAMEHGNGINDTNLGSDPFKWVLLICIGYQCFELKRFRDYHNIKGASYKDIKKWIKDNAELGSHDGDSDYLSLVAGVYKEFV